MPEIDIEIGGRVFQVACQDGEQHFLQSAAQLLDNEAQSLADALGRVPETRMLLMAGLMLADKTAGLEEELRLAEQKLAELTARGSQSTPVPVAPTAPAAEVIRETVEVEVIPPAVFDTLRAIADRAEAVATSIEDNAA